MFTASYAFEGEEHVQLRREVRRFASEHIAPFAEAWEEAEEFPTTLYRAAGQAGILGVGFSESHGGSGGDLTHLLVAAEELILAGKSVGTAVGLCSHNIALPPILASQDRQLIETWAPAILRGDAISALAITEPGAGSDVASLTTRASRDGDEFVVSGAKTFITSGCRANLVVTAVRTGGPGHGGISLLAIPTPRSGMAVASSLKKTGWWPSDTAALSFDGCRVPATYLIGRENQGFAIIMRNFVSERLLLAAQCVAIGELAFAEALRYAGERTAFGGPLVSKQVIRHKLADMETELAAARALVGSVAGCAGDVQVRSAAMAKNAASDMVSRVVAAAVQIHGGAGYMRGTVVERLYRDARLYSIGGGTREVMNELIARSYGGDQKQHKA